MCKTITAGIHLRRSKDFQSVEIQFSETVDVDLKKCTPLQIREHREKVITELASEAERLCAGVLAECFVPENVTYFEAGDKRRKR